MFLNVEQLDTNARLETIEEQLESVDESDKNFLKEEKNT
jgi:hypothetical protein